MKIIPIRNEGPGGTLCLMGGKGCGGLFYKKNCTYTELR